MHASRPPKTRVGTFFGCPLYSYVCSTLAKSNDYSIYNVIRFTLSKCAVQSEIRNIDNISINKLIDNIQMGNVNHVKRKKCYMLILSHYILSSVGGTKICNDMQ